MNDAHWHLLFNHLPVLGIPFGLGLLLFSLRKRDVSLQRAGFVVLILGALAAGLAYLTGEPAEDVLKNVATEIEPWIEAHEDTALIGLIGAMILGVTSLWGVWRQRARGYQQNLVVTLLILGIGVSGVLAWAAKQGGEIRHSEIRAGASSVASVGRDGDD